MYKFFKGIVRRTFHKRLASEEVVMRQTEKMHHSFATDMSVPLQYHLIQCMRYAMSIDNAISRCTQKKTTPREVHVLPAILAFTKFEMVGDNNQKIYIRALLSSLKKCGLRSFYYVLKDHFLLKNIQASTSR